MLLHDHDGDWEYESSTPFLEGLAYPTGVLAWKNGVLITCAPEVLYAEDTDGDGVADVRETVLSGFVEGNPQHRVNGLRWHPDGWIYGANGDSGAHITIPSTGETVALGMRDFRFQPDTGKFEPQPGPTQFGICCDDWGHWYGGNNSVILWSSPLTGRTTDISPSVRFPSLRTSLTAHHTTVFALSEVEPRFNAPDQAGRITSACSPEFYRAEALGAAYAGNLFVCEPVHRLVHRRVVERAGGAVRLNRAHEDAAREFLASTDPWFRPVFLRTGPDGALWLADMQREVIEHPEWIPDDWEARIDLRAGENHGRIWRVLPRNRPLPPPQWPEDRSITELIEDLGSSNAWRRDAASRTLIAHARAGPSHQSPGVRDGLVRAFHLSLISHRSPEAEEDRAKRLLQIASTLDQCGHLADEHLPMLWADPHPEVRAYALRRCADRLRLDGDHRSLGPILIDAATDPPAECLWDLLWAFRAWQSPEVAALAPRLLDGSLSPLERAALWNAAEGPGAEPFLRSLLPELDSATDETIWAELGSFVSGSNEVVLLAFLENLLTGLASDTPAPALYAIDRWLSSVGSEWGSLRRFAESTSPGLREAVGSLAERLDRVRTMALDDSVDSELRRIAVAALGSQLFSSDEEDLTRLRDAMLQLLGPQTAPTVQREAIRQLCRTERSDIAEALLGSWSSYGPTTRSAVLESLLQRTAWTHKLLSAIEGGHVNPREIDARHRQRLLQHPEDDLRQHAVRALDLPESNDRAELVQRYVEGLANHEGDPTRGRAVFERLCATCHEPPDGSPSAPDLQTVQHWNAEMLLAAILDPNRAVDPRFLGYLAWTHDGRVLEGLLAEETDTAIVLQDVDGERHHLPRTELDELKRTERSAMPEGLEHDLPLQDAADVVSYVRSRRPPRRTFDGNQPELVPSRAGVTSELTAINASIYGASLRYESNVRCLGYWSGLDDQAVWTLELDAPRQFELELEFACAASTAGNTIAFLCGDQAVEFEVPSTETWLNYERKTLGRMTLEAGLHTVVARAAPPLQGYLIDLRALRLVPVD